MRSRRNRHCALQRTLYAFLSQALSYRLCSSQTHFSHMANMLNQHPRSRVKAQPDHMNTHFPPLTRQLNTTDKP